MVMSRGSKRLEILPQLINFKIGDQVIITRIYQDLPGSIQGPHQWVTIDGRQQGKNQVLKIPLHVPQVMIKLPLKCIHRPPQ